VDPVAVNFGKTVELSGLTDPATPGQAIEIVDADDPATVLAGDTTGASGGYSVEIPAPPENVRLQAVWVETGATSEPVLLKVRPLLRAKLTKPRLFDIVKVRGSITPAQPGDNVHVTLFHAGKVDGKRTVPLKNGGKTFKANFLVEETGNYRGRARFDDEDHLADTDWTTKRWAKLPPNLHTGSGGIWVKLLEKRLRSLDYHLPGANKDYNNKTADAVLAFHKVQRMNRIKNVTGKTWKRLQHPIQPDPRNKKRPFHIEIDQSRQVLYVIRKGEIDEIVHTSTGAGGATHDGVFYVHRKIAGYSPNNLYYPSYFDGQRAVHGWPEVPAYPASHGCARVPNWTAIWLHNIMPYGTQVRVYHS
jgi:L,D-transpeptidase catalytic domain